MEPNKLFTYDRLSEFVNNYKEFVAKKKKEEEELDPNLNAYSYYHFSNNPNGIIMDSIGRFGQNILSSVSAWSPMKNKNGIDAWRINLARGLVKFRENEFNLFQTNKKPGLDFIINYDELPIGVYYNTPNMNIDQEDYAYRTSISYTDRGSDNSITGTSNDFSSLQAATANKLGLNKTSLRYKMVTVDWHGFFLAPAGNYSITCNAENCLFYIWVGDNAVCQFMNDNADVNNNTTTSEKFFFPYEQFRYIRIQIYYFGNVQEDVSFELVFNRITLKNKTEMVETISFGNVPNTESPTFMSNQYYNMMSGENADMIINTPDSSSPSSSPSGQSFQASQFFCNVPNYYPLILYCAFVSQNEQDFLNNQFLCYSMVEFQNNELVVKDYTQLGILYQNIRMFMTQVLNNDYDYNTSNRLSYGVLPPINMQYTIIEPGSSNSPATTSTPTNGTPFAFALYKLNSDYRMGKIYQIGGVINENFAYPMHEIGKDFITNSLSYADNYEVFPGFYPNANAIDVQYYNKAVNKNELECKEFCNNSTNCAYYFAYSSNGTDKCIIDTDNSVPVFNRVPPSNTNEPVDKGSQSLYLRNYQFDLSGNPNKECLILNDNVQNNVIPIVNNSNYSDTFTYSNYNLDKNMKITSPNEMGLCGNPEYKKKLNEAEQILFKDTTYYKNGTFVENFSNAIPDSKYTDAIDDTSDGIRTNLNNEVLYAEKQEKINKNYQELNNLIPEYEETRNEIKIKEQLYEASQIKASSDQKGPRILKKKIMDNNELYLSSKLLFTLGTVSVTTLLIFAIVLARD
jgi:hypothetical protein